LSSVLIKKIWQATPCNRTTQVTHQRKTRGKVNTN